MLAYANKMDLPNPLSIYQVIENIQSDKINDREWLIQSAGDTVGDGLYEGLDWLLRTLNEEKFSPNIDEEGISWIDHTNCKMLLANRRKTILLISGWVRNIDIKYQLNIASNLTKLIHEFYHEQGVNFDKNHTFYG